MQNKTWYGWAAPDILIEQFEYSSSAVEFVALLNTVVVLQRSMVVVISNLPDQALKQFDTPVSKFGTNKLEFFQLLR